MKWLEPAVDRPLPVFLAAVMIAAMGFWCLNKLPVNQSPSINIPYAVVVVPYPGALPEDVESEVTVELEDALSSIDGLQHMNSKSGLGLGRVFLKFDDHSDMDELAQKVRDATDVASAEFPDEAERARSFEVSFDTLPIIMFTLRGPVGLDRLREIAEELKPSMESVEGVSGIDIFGGYQPEIRIHAEPLALAQHGLTLADLRETLRHQSRNIPTGRLATQGRDHLIRSTGEFTSLAEIRSITVATESSGPVSLSDVATVKIAHESIQTGAYYDGAESVTLIAKRSPRVNTLEIVRNLKAQVEELRATLPDGVEITVTSDSSREIGDMISQLGTSAGWGMVLVVVALMAVFGYRQAILVASVLPFALLFTFIGLYIFDMAISNIALFSLILVLGLVVDGAIIVGEAIFTEREAGASPNQASKRGIARVGLPVIAADLTTIAAFVPMLLMVGVMGQFMSVMPKVVVFALLGSIFIDHFFLPAAAAREGRKGRLQHKAPKFNFIRQPYLRALDWSLNHRRRICLGSLAAFVVAMMAFKTGAIPAVFMPTVDHSRFWVNYALPLGTPLEETNRVGLLLAKDMEARLSEITHWVLTTGQTGALNSKPQETGRSGPEFGKLTIELTPPGERLLSQSDLVEQVREIAREYAGVKISFEEFSDGPPVGAAIELAIRGDNLDELVEVARNLEGRIGALPEARDLRVDYDAGKPKVNVEVDRARAQSHFGITPDQVSRALLTAFHGEEVGRMWLSGERVDIRLRAPDDLAYTVDTVRELPLRASSGEIIPLGQVADVTLGFSHNAIYRQDGKRTVTLMADTSPQYSSVALQRDVSEILAEMSIPGSIQVEFGGQREENTRSTNSAISALGWALILIYAIIAIQFNSLTQPLIVLCTIPLSLIGVALGLFLSGNPFSFMASIGIVALTGIVVNDGIVMVDAINQSKASGLPLREALLDAAARRFRPVVLTTVTTIAGLLPLTLQVVEGGEFWVALGVTIISGLLVASVLTLFIVPVMYSLMSRRQPSTLPEAESLESTAPVEINSEHVVAPG